MVGGEMFHDASEVRLARRRRRARSVVERRHLDVFDTLGSARLTPWLAKLHVGDPPGERPRVDDDRSLRAAEFASGEVAKATHLQMAAAYGAVFNDAGLRGAVVRGSPLRRDSRAGGEHRARPVRMLEGAVRRGRNGSGWAHRRGPGLPERPAPPVDGRRGRGGVLRELRRERPGLRAALRRPRGGRGPRGESDRSDGGGARVERARVSHPERPVGVGAPTYATRFDRCLLDHRGQLSLDDGRLQRPTRQSRAARCGTPREPFRARCAGDRADRRRHAGCSTGRIIRSLPFPFAIAVALSAWPLVTGCSSSSNPGAPDGAAPVPVTSDAQSDSPGEDSGPNACADASVRTIQASNYDQSCKVDTDCRLIGEGNACTPCAFNCPFSGAINAGALAQYTSDVANTPAVAASFNGQPCFAGCPAASVHAAWPASVSVDTGQCPAPDAGAEPRRTAAVPPQMQPEPASTARGLSGAQRRLDPRRAAAPVVGGRAGRCGR